MSNKTQKLELRGDRELVLTRRFSAPCRLVWMAYTDCKHLSHWWGPKGWDLTHCELDFRPGGKWHYCMAGEYEGNFEESWGLATYKEIDAPNRFVYDEVFSDKDGNASPDMPQMVITVLLEEQEGETLLTTVTLFESAEARQQTLDMGVEQGITETWDRLDTFLATM